MPSSQLDELEALRAMRLFLAEWARQTNSIDAGRLVDELNFSHFYPDGRPILVDQGDWNDWLRAVETVVQSGKDKTAADDL